MLDVSDRLIVIIGGGAVAARKAAGLLSAGAKRVRVIAPEFKANFDAQVQQVAKKYEAADLLDADLIFATTDSASVNDQIVRDANTRGIWVNRADNSEMIAGDFVTPARFQSGPITVMVSAGSAALTALVRDEIEKQFDPGWTTMAEAMQTLRAEIKSQFTDVNHRRDLFRALATPEAIGILQQRGIGGLRTWIFEQF